MVKKLGGDNGSAKVGSNSRQLLFPVFSTANPFHHSFAIAVACRPPFPPPALQLRRTKENNNFPSPVKRQEVTLLFPPSRQQTKLDGRGVVAGNDSVEKSCPGFGVRCRCCTSRAASRPPQISPRRGLQFLSALSLPLPRVRREKKLLCMSSPTSPPFVTPSAPLSRCSEAGYFLHRPTKQARIFFPRKCSPHVRARDRFMPVVGGLRGILGFPGTSCPFF